MFVNRFLVAGTAIAGLSACMGSSGCVGSPADVSFGGLAYDACPDVSDFLGLDQTNPASLPSPSGDVTYTGVLRGNIGATYQDGTAQVVADFSTPEATVSGHVDFEGDSGVGVVSFTETVPITGSAFGNLSSTTPSTVIINGAFYGSNGEVAAGTVVIDNLPDDQVMTGAFITTQDLR